MSLIGSIRPIGKKAVEHKAGAIWNCLQAKSIKGLIITTLGNWTVNPGLEPHFCVKYFCSIYLVRRRKFEKLKYSALTCYPW